MTLGPFKPLAGRLCILVGIASILCFDFHVCGAITRGGGEPQQEKKQAVADELALLQGTWQLVCSETDGRKMPEEQVRQIRVVIEGSRHTVLFGDKVLVRAAKFTVDPTTQPKSSEYTLEDEPNKGMRIRRIYRLEGDTMTSCVGANDARPPTEFSAKSGSGQSLHQYRRVQLAVAQVRNRDNDADTKDYRELEGRWRIVSMKAFGADLPAETFRNRRIVFKGREYTNMVDMGEGRGTFVLDATKSPKTMDIFFKDGDFTMVYKAIYELNGNTCKLCGMITTKSRPASFDAKLAGGGILEVLERVKE